MNQKKSSPKRTSISSKKKRSTDHRKSIKYRCDSSPTPLKVLQARGWTRISDSKDTSWNVWWCDTCDLKFALDGYNRLKTHQRVSHFRNHCELSRKNYLYRNLKRYRKMLIKAGKVREAEFCDCMPTSFELPNEYRMLVEEYRRKPGTTWIVKPAGGSRGRGIFLFQRLKDLVDWRARECAVPPNIDLNDPEVTYCPETYVVQKYIDDPYLLEGHKFDLRLYVLVTSFQPLKVWLAREGFARLSGEKFSLDCINDSRVHLTNMSIQLKSTPVMYPSACNGHLTDGGKRSPMREPGLIEGAIRDDGNESEGGADNGDARKVKLGRKWPLRCLKEHLIERHGEKAVEELLMNIAENELNNGDSNEASSSDKKENNGLCESVENEAEQDEINGKVCDDEVENKDGNNEEDGNQNAEPSEPSQIDENKNTDGKSEGDKTDAVGDVQSEQVEEENLDNKVESSPNVDEKKEEDVNQDEAKPEASASNDDKPESSEKSRPTKKKRTKKTAKPARNPIKTLRVGWLHRSTKDEKYEKMKAPLGGVRRFKISEDSIYPAEDIKRMAIAEFNGKKRRKLEDEYEVRFGLADGEVLDHFYMADGRICDLWGYCKALDTTPYKLNVFLLTTTKVVEEKTLEETPKGKKRPRKRRSKKPKTPKKAAKDSVRVFYHYTRVSKYSNEPSATELQKPDLHAYLLEEQHGDGPDLEKFEPVDYGYFISKIERNGETIFEVYYDEYYVKCYTFPSIVAVEPNEHKIVYDVDVLRGNCCGKYGVGVITSCTDECRPVFTWYRDGEVYKTGEFLYWLNCTDDCEDGAKHSWSCSVRCKGSEGELRSKEITI